MTDTPARIAALAVSSALLVAIVIVLVQVLRHLRDINVFLYVSERNRRMTFEGIKAAHAKLDMLARQQQQQKAQAERLAPRPAVR